MARRNINFGYKFGMGEGMNGSSEPAPANVVEKPSESAAVPADVEEPLMVEDSCQENSLNESSVVVEEVQPEPPSEPVQSKSERSAGRRSNEAEEKTWRICLK